MKTLKQLREERKLTQFELATKVNGKIKPGNIGAIELNQISMTRKNAEVLAPVFGMTPDELMVNHHAGIIKQEVATKGKAFKEKIGYLLGVAEDENQPTEVRLAVLKGLRSIFTALPEENDRDAFGRKRNIKPVNRDGLGRARNNEPAERDAMGRVRNHGK